MKQAWHLGMAAAALLDDFGLTDALLRLVQPRMQVLLAAVKSDDLRTVEKLVGKRFSGRATSLVQGGLKKHPELKDYRYQIIFGGLPADAYWIDGAYNPYDKTLHVYLNVGKASSKYGNPMYRLDWEYRGKRECITELESLDVLIRHEATHMIRDSQTGHLRRNLDNETLSQSSIYMQTGHTEDNDEIDAIVNELDQLKKRLGSAAYDKLTPSMIERLVPGREWPKKPEVIHRWVKRLIREGLLTTGMRQELRL